MLATLLISLSGGVAVLTLADLFLSNTQKTWLSNAVIKAWSVLDEAKGWSLTDWLKQPRARWWLAISVGLFMAAYYILMTHHTGRTLHELLVVLPEDAAVLDFFLYLLGATLIGTFIVFVSLPIFARLLNVSRGRLAIILLCSLAAVYLIAFFADFALEDEQPWLFLLGTFGLIIALIFVLCVLMIFVSIAVAYIASAVLFVGEFVVRRIAEYPKGPVLALSAFFGGIVALIKAFG
jgi:hypothetical protein